MLINKETPRVGNAMLPRDLYVVRCLTSKFSLSKAGNPMTTLECEVVSDKNGNEVIQGPDGTPISLTGNRFRLFLIYTKDQAGKVFDFTKNALGIELESINEENPDIEFYVGKKWCHLLYSTASVRTGADGKPILDAQGNPLAGPNQIQARIEDGSLLV